MNSTKKVLSYLVVICLTVGVVGSNLLASDSNATVKNILQTYLSTNEEPVWEVATALRSLGEDAIPELNSAANNITLPVGQRLAAAAALLQLGEQRAGTLAIEDIIISENNSIEKKLEAAEMLSKWGGEYAAARLGILMESESLPEILKVELAFGLWKLSGRPQAYEVLEDIYRNGKSVKARSEALLALGRTDNFYLYKNDLYNLADKPGPLGEQAHDLIMLNAAVANDVSKDGVTERLIAEIVQKIRDYYAIDEQDAEQLKNLEPKSMAEASARALLYSIDQFNDYLNEEDFADFDSQLRANYGGIGAYVGMRDNRFTILTPMYDKPAYKAGLRPMDIIDRIDDTDITEMKQNDIVKLLRGEPNTIAKVRVWRRGWKEPRFFNVKREVIQIDSVVSQELPGGIGYIRINTFNDGDPFKKIKGTAALVKDALIKFDKAGGKGVILDLSNNPGGVLDSGVDVAGIFIGENKLVVSSMGKHNKNNAKKYYAPRGKPFYTKPLVVMVNSGSASASEIVAGALKDHHRALLVGQKTYGKGSVQSLMGVKTFRDRARVKLTIAKYYLPSGDSIHKKGIEPDNKVTEYEPSAAEAEARWQMRDQHDIQFWLEEDDRWGKYENRFRELLAYDNYQPSAYPDFESLYTTLKEKYPKEFIDEEMVRKELRYGIASYLRDFKGENWYVDIEENATLQDAIVTLGEEIGGLPDIPLYRDIEKKVEEARKKDKEADKKTEEK